MMAGAERLLADYTGHMCHLGPPAAMADFQTKRRIVSVSLGRPERPFTKRTVLTIINVRLRSRLRVQHIPLVAKHPPDGG